MPRAGDTRRGSRKRRTSQPLISAIFARTTCCQPHCMRMHQGSARLSRIADTGVCRRHRATRAPAAAPRDDVGASPGGSSPVASRSGARGGPDESEFLAGGGSAQPCGAGRHTARRARARDAAAPGGSERGNGARTRGGALARAGRVGKRGAPSGARKTAQGERETHPECKQGDVGAHRGRAGGAQSTRPRAGDRWLHPATPLLRPTAPRAPRRGFGSRGRRRRRVRSRRMHLTSI